MASEDAAKPADLVRAFLASLLKAALTSEEGHGRQWREEAAGFRGQLGQVDAEALDRLKLDGLWWLALGDATAPELRPEEGQIEFAQPKTCPIAMPEIVSAEVAIDGLVDRLVKSAATG
ncbi:hypothetical protein [Methylobacterium oryzihabitans]|uniref:Uncharacterized protein n=1 Tax=Methylobacterium oryzihabitans TaxID=2499852 RepID=A0A437P2R3_9HYPH|nr:hypothetical protein [Methylobacterium oryzihabitans]RVU16428.1 hypothetical protein EOE48_17235 [Methylobacterium oryzihabitans]